MHDDLKLLLAEVQERLRARVYQNESSVRGNIFVPLLRTLGWDINDPRLVHHEYGFDGNKAADIMLCTPDKEDAAKYPPCCVIELKRHGIVVAAEKQVFEYAVHAGTRLALISNGQKFSFYYPLSEGERAERLIAHLDICERPLDQAATTLERYISFENINSGLAIENALEDLKARKALRQSLAESASELAEEQKSEAATHNKPKKMRVAQYSFLGREGRTFYGTIYFEVLEELYEKFPYILDRLENVLVERKSRKGEVKKEFSRNHNEVFRDNRAKQFVDGWWINTQLTQAKILSMLAEICREANIPFGDRDGLWIEGMEEIQSENSDYAYYGKLYREARETNSLSSDESASSEIS